MNNTSTSENLDEELEQSNANDIPDTDSEMFGPNTARNVAEQHQELERAMHMISGPVLSLERGKHEEPVQTLHEARQEIAKAIDELMNAETPEGIDGREAHQEYMKLAYTSRGHLEPSEKAFHGFYTWLRETPDDKIRRDVNAEYGELP